MKIISKKARYPMNDRILFRGMRVDNKEWFYGQVAYFNGQPFIIGEIIDCDEEYIDIESWWSVDPDTVGQCTGLTAAKSYRGDGPEDRLVFEGDIIKTCHKNDVIVWDSITMRWYTHNSGPLSEFNDIEIIGNRWDHKELLEG